MGACFCLRMDYVLLVLAGWTQKLRNVKIPSFQDLDPLPRFLQWCSIEEDIIARKPPHQTISLRGKREAEG